MHFWCLIPLKEGNPWVKSLGRAFLYLWMRAWTRLRKVSLPLLFPPQAGHKPVCPYGFLKVCSTEPEGYRTCISHSTSFVESLIWEWGEGVSVRLWPLASRIQVCNSLWWAHPFQIAFEPLEWLCPWIRDVGVLSLSIKYIEATLVQLLQYSDGKRYPSWCNEVGTQLWWMNETEYQNILSTFSFLIY